MVQAGLLVLELTLELEKVKNMEKLNGNVFPEQARRGIKPILEDVKINVKIKLSILWVTLMFFYIYADILAFYQPGHIEKVISGEIGGMQITQAFLLASAIIMAIPSVMVFLSLTLKAKANRWTNIILGIYHAGLLLTTNALVAGEIWGFHMLQASTEAVLIALIVWHAWKWPKQEG